jgi:hypothetical protein
MELFFKNALSKNLFEILNEYINRINLNNTEIFTEAVLKFNLLCYAHIKKLDEEYVDYYEYYSLYDNFYNTWETINNLNNIYSTEIFITILERLNYNDEFTEFFKYLNHIDDNDDDDDEEELYDSDDLVEVFIKKFIYTFKILNNYLYNNNFFKYGFI